MKKHFLILMLMALLPMVGWAQATNLNGYEITFDPDQEYQYYTGANQKPTIVLQKTGAADIAEADVNVVWKNSNGETVTEIKNVGEYVVTVTAKGNTYGNLAQPTKSFWVLQAANGLTTDGEGAIIVQTAYETDAQKHQFPYDTEGVGYDLIKTEPTVAFGNDSKLYLVTETSTAPTTTEGWKATLSKVNKVGKHYVWVKVAETDNYAAYGPALVDATNQYVEITGTPWAITDFTAPASAAGEAEGLAFNNAEQALINKGTITSTTKTGTFMYKLGDGQWQEAIPTAKGAATYSVAWKIVGGDGIADYTAGTPISVKILPAAPTITPGAVKSLTYNGGNQVLINEGSITLGATPTYTIQYRATTAVDWGAESAAKTTLADVTGKDAGFYKVTTSVAEAGNYLAATASTEVEIKKAPLTISTKAATKVYGETDPTFEAVYSGFVGEETAAALVTATEFVAPEFTRAGVGTTAGENVGSYKITITNSATVIAKAKNYAVTYNADLDKDLTITQRPLVDGTPFTFTLTPDSKEYTGSALEVGVTAKYNGNDMATPADYTFVFSNNTEVGTANVVISGQGNFKGSVVKTFAITGQAIYILPTAAEKNYGATDPELTAYTLVNAAGAVVEGATLHGDVVLKRVAGENAGAYKIYVESYTADPADSYAPVSTYFGLANVNNENAKTGWFTIKPSTSTLVFNFKEGTTATKVYGEANPEWSIDDLVLVSGNIDGDDWAKIKPTMSTPNFAIASENYADNATNKVTVTGFASANYPNVTVTPIAFTITKRPIAVVVENQTVTYGNNVISEDSKWSVADGYSLGTVGGVLDGKAAVGIKLSTVNSIGTYTPGETYNDAIQASITGESGNYELVLADCVNGKLTVNPIGDGDAIVFDKEDGNMLDKIVAFDGQTRDVTVKLYRKNVVGSNTYTWGRAQWNPMVLPFEVSVRELSTAIGYAIVNTYDESNTKESNAGFKLTMGTIPANTPFLLKTDADITEGFELNFTAKEIVAPTGDMTLTATNGISFIGTYEDVEINKSNSQAQDGAETYWKYYANNEIKGIGKTSVNKYTVYPFGGFFNWTAPSASAPAMTITVQDADGTITSISSIESEDEINASGWYNLNGIKLEGAPTQKGVYIKDGKKIIVK